MDTEELKFKLLLEEKRHKELMSALSNISLETLSVGLKDSISQLVRFSGDSRDTVRELAKVINNNNEGNELVTLFDRFVKDLDEKLNKIYLLVQHESERKKEWEFTINRSQHNGLIESVTAKQIR